ncbi:MAG: AraC family transcriptional regulator [Pseudonocardia sp.]|nr:AraC family transcriptional regulator [Pseudonocardia sp.]
MAAPVRVPQGETPLHADAEGIGAASLADSPVPDSWQMHERRAPAALRPYVSSYTGYRMEASPRSTHHGVASPHLTFLLCLDGKVEILANADRSKPPGAFVAMVGGLHDGPAEIAQGEPQTGLQLRLTWRGARMLLRVPAGELAGDVVDLAALLGRRSRMLLDRLAAAPGWSERFALLDAELAALAAQGRGDAGVAPEVGYAWDRLEESGGNLRIAELASEVGWSRRYLAEKFRAETGLAPKAAARVIRFEGACDRLRGPHRPPLARVAADAGYVDQAHLSRDFRDLAGTTATSWLADRRHD